MERQSNGMSVGSPVIRLAVVILNWNGEEMLRTFLPSVWRYSQEEGVVLYVADNGSSDGSCAWLNKNYPQVRLIRLEQNYGFAEGYNRALAQVEAACYLLLNSDVEVTEHWLSPLLDYMDSHSDTAACQPKLLNWHDKGRFEYAGACGGYLDRLGYPYCRGRIFDTVEEDKGQYDTVAPVCWASGAALLVRSADYWAVGGLDGSFFAHMEEIDLCWRLRHAGRKIVCVPQSRVYHAGGATLHQGDPHKTYLNFRNNLLMLYKNLPARQLPFVMGIRFLLDRVAMTAFLLKGDTAGAKAVWRARRDFRRMASVRKEARRKVWEQVRMERLPEQRPASILWSYYIKGIRAFSSLPEKKKTTI